MKLTPWFSGARRPARCGVYEWSDGSFRFFDGVNWHFGTNSAYGAMFRATDRPWERFNGVAAMRGAKWRGLASKDSK